MIWINWFWIYFALGITVACILTKMKILSWHRRRWGRQVDKVLIARAEDRGDFLGNTGHTIASDDWWKGISGHFLVETGQKNHWRAAEMSTIVTWFNAAVYLFIFSNLMVLFLGYWTFRVFLPLWRILAKVPSRTMGAKESCVLVTKETLKIYKILFV